MKHIKRFVTAAMTMLLLAGCAENPEADIVIHKDMEKVIQEAQHTDESKADVEQLRQYDSYTADIENENLRVSIHADAEVDIPQVNQLSIFRIKQHSFTQDEIDTVRKALFGDAVLYDGISMTQETKADLELKIAHTREALEAVTAGVPQNDAEKQDRNVMMEEWQRRLDDLQAQYEAAPAETPKIISDGKLQNTAEMLQKGENKTYWEWQNDLSGKEILELRNADNTAVLYVQNNPDHSNKISFRTSPVGAEKCDSVVVSAEPLDAKTRNGIEEPFLDHDADLDGVKVEPMPNDRCTLTREQAEQKAQAFLQTISPVQYGCFEGGKYAEYLHIEDQNRHCYRTCWILRYCRSIDGVLLEQNSGLKYAETGSGENFQKHLWPAEMIELHINDDGIVWMDWLAPLEMTETIVEKTTLKPFSDICGTFEKMMPMVEAVSDQSDPVTKIDITRVTLSYSRISEKNSFDTGIVVPVWGFIGTCKRGLDSDPETGVQMAINAIDGSVIDSTLGY